MKLLLAVYLFAVSLMLLHLLRRLRQARRRALLDGADTLLRRSATQWETDPNRAVESEQCAMVLQRMTREEAT